MRRLTRSRRWQTPSGHERQPFGSLLRLRWALAASQGSASSQFDRLHVPGLMVFRFGRSCRISIQPVLCRFGVGLRANMRRM